MNAVFAVFGTIGKPIIGLTSQTARACLLLLETLKWLIIGPFQKKFARRQFIVHQMVFAGVDSLVIAFFVAFFTGIVIAMQTAPQLKDFGATIFVASLVSVSICRELGPVFTALVVAGRVGSAIAAELGTMKVTEQVEALETIALNPVRFLVVPRFIALVVMLPCLTIIADLAGIGGGFLVGTLSLDLDAQQYIDVAFKYLQMKDVMTGILKSVAFAIAISIVGCYKGLNTSGGAEGVGKSTTESVVISFILIILFDCILTGIFYFTGV